jgi:hypothetical protein
VEVGERVVCDEQAEARRGVAQFSDLTTGAATAAADLRRIFSDKACASNVATLFEAAQTSGRCREYYRGPTVNLPAHLYSTLGTVSRELRETLDVKEKAQNKRGCALGFRCRDSG